MMLRRALDTMPCAAAGLRKIDAADQQHELFVAENDFAFFALGRGPAKAALLQTFRAYPEAAAVPEQELEAVALRVGEEKDVAAQRVAGQPVAHQSEEAFEALAHVRGARSQIDTCGASDTEHNQAPSAFTT
jgi:hypothetical protein